jgi:uncharacterized membrane protein
LRLGERSRTTTFVYATTALYAFVFAGAAAFWHLAYQTSRFDLGNMVQAVWSTAHGHFLQETSLGGRQMTRLGAHVDPFLALLAPLFRIVPSPILLLVLQAVAVSLGALPVYWLARKHLGSERAAAHFAVAYLVFPAVQWNAWTASSDFHPASFALPLLMYAIWFLDEDRLLAFGACALVGATTKEQMPLIFGCLGLWYGLSRRRYLVGAGVFLAGLAASALAFLVVIPHFAAPGAHPFADRYAAIGRTPTGILETAFTHPGRLVSDVATWHKLVYLGLLLVPFLGMWALAPTLLLCAAPELAINLLSSKPDQTTVTFHYTAGIVPFIVVATIFGVAKLKRAVDQLSLWVLAGTLSIAILTPFLYGPGRFAQALPWNPDHRAKASALALIPAGVPVSASDHLAAQLSERSRILVFPVVRDARWIVVDRNDDTYGDAAGYRRVISKLGRNPHWTLLYSRRGVSVFHRNA